MYSDGQCDLSGSSAKFLTFTVMEDSSNFILSTLTVVKSEIRTHTHMLCSNCMSVVLQCILLYLGQIPVTKHGTSGSKKTLGFFSSKIVIKELTTDSSSTVIAVSFLVCFRRD